MFKWPTCEVTCNLQPNGCTVWAAANFESYTMCLVHLTRCGRGLTYEGKSPLQLQGSISGQRAGLRVSSESLIDMDVKLRESLCFHQITLLIVLFSFIWARDIWPIIDQLDAVRYFHFGVLSSWKSKDKICSSDIISTWLAVYLVNTKSATKRMHCVSSCRIRKLHNVSPCRSSSQVGLSPKALLIWMLNVEKGFTFIKSPYL